MFKLFKSKYHTIHERNEIVNSVPHIAASQPYLECSELPMYNFVKCSLTGDLKWLMKEGIPNEKTNEVWDTIKVEYSDLCKDGSQKLSLELAKSIEYLEKKVFISKTIIEILFNGRDEDYILMLQSDPLFFPFSYENLEDDLKKTLIKLKFDEMQIETKQAEYDEIIKVSGQNETSLQDYEEQMTGLSKWAGCLYSLQNTTVSQYIALITMFNNANKPN